MEKLLKGNGKRVMNLIWTELQGYQLIHIIHKERKESSKEKKEITTTNV
jgi:hypothetical protein